MEIGKLIEKAIEKKASDLHLVTNLPPIIRVAGEVITMDSDKLSTEEIKEIIYSILTEEQKAIFEKEWKISFSILYKELAHIRISLYYHLGRIEAAIRLRKMDIDPLEKLGLPASVSELLREPHGLILITGPTGSGKTTTFYSMIDRINQERRCKIIIVEDPVEYIHQHNKSIIIQQELGKDFKTFHSALMHILRLDPDIICVGEMRELETIQTALIAAETGHLVIGTLHTGDATQTIDRIINAFMPHERAEVSLQLANCFRGTVAQALLPTVDKKNRALACEVLIASEAVRNIIRENRLQSLYNAMLTAKDQGMQTMDMSLKDLHDKGIISYDIAAARARDPKFILGKY